MFMKRTILRLTSILVVAAMVGVACTPDDELKENENNSGDNKNPQEAIPEAVDLGLSVKWATFNVGASNPEESGDFYAWGETEPKTDYSWETYKWCNVSDTTMTKYCNDSEYGYNGYTDFLTILEASDDVASVKWGGSWRMPTQAEFEELSNSSNCTWTWTTQNGVNGYLVTSKKSGYEGASIFLPAAGHRCDTILNNVGDYGDYRSSSLFTTYPCGAWNLDFYSHYRYMDNNYRYFGFSVRPVCPSEEWLSHITVSIDKDTVSLFVRENSELKADVYYDNEKYSSPVTIRWTSDNPSVATVNDEGIITAKGEGTCTVTANLGTAQSSCTVVVKNPYGNENGYEYVDLGLSVKWATCNVGASKPEEWGNYYAWGETEPKTNYTYDNYRYFVSGSMDAGGYHYNPYTVVFSKYNDIDKIVLDPEDDVAHVKWGGNWRMPTQEEWKELVDNCIWLRYDENGVSGYRVYKQGGNIKSPFIFIPDAGTIDYGYHDDSGSNGAYWTSEIALRDNCYSFGYYGGWKGEHGYTWGVYNYLNRCTGLSVRPVCP